MNRLVPTGLLGKDFQLVENLLKGGRRPLIRRTPRRSIGGGFRRVSGVVPLLQCLQGILQGLGVHPAGARQGGKVLLQVLLVLQILQGLKAFQCIQPIQSAQAGKSPKTTQTAEGFQRLKSPKAGNALGGEG